MYLKHLSLTNYRNYRRLELDFTRPLTLLQGANAQGKTNLLEAIYFLATSRSTHARSDRQVINWEVEHDPLPFARLTADVEKAGRPLKLEVTIAPAGTSPESASFRKQIRLNGVPRRALDLVGELKVVLFLPQDIELVAGSPAGRRRYLDIALCQIDRSYCAHLTQYGQSNPARRNRVLRQIDERGSDPEQLSFWDEQLAAHAGIIVARRLGAVASLAGHVRRFHAELTGGAEDLQLDYVPSFLPAGPDAAPAEIGSDFLERLRETRRRKIAAGSTLIGPHRDDLHFAIGGRDLQEYGSRGQQRTAAMALKLGEVELMTGETGEYPVLLLDDVMSELDASRRTFLAGLLEGARQAILTTTDTADFAPTLLARLTRWRVSGGELFPDDATAADRPASAG